MRKINYIYAISYSDSREIKFDPKVEFSEFKMNIKKIVDPVQRALFCQQAILKTFYVYRDINSFLNEEEFNSGLRNFNEPWFQKTMKLGDKVGQTLSDLVEFYQKEIKSHRNNFNIETQQLLLESLKVYNIIAYSEKVVDTKNADLKLVVNKASDCNKGQIETSKQNSNV